MNLETTYLGFHLRTPLVISASPLTGDLDNLRRLEDAGASAVVLPSIFEEQIRQQFNDPSWSLTHGIEPYPPSLSYLPKREDFAADPEGHLDRIRNASRALSIPVIASISGTAAGDWAAFSMQMQEAGASAIELSIYHVPTSLEADAAGIEAAYARMVADVRAQISIPLAVKLVPYFTSIPHIARRFVESGANGLVFFNRLFGADIDLDDSRYTHSTRYTASSDVDLPLRWIALLRDRIPADFAASGGVHTGVDALKLIAAGAHVTMLCSALMLHGIEHLQVVEGEMIRWLDEHGHPSLEHIRGSLCMERWQDRSVFERANYIWTVGDFVPEIKRDIG